MERRGGADEDAVDRILGDWARERPGMDTSPVQVIGRLGRVAAHVAPAIERNLAERGLGAASFDLLATLRRAGPPYRLAPRELVAQTLKTSGTVTTRIDRLEAEGLVRREPDPADRRGVLVALTPEGNAALEDALPAHLEAQERLLAGLDDTERAELAGLLRRLLVSLEAHDGGREQSEVGRLGLRVVGPGTARRLRRAVGLPERDGALVRSVERGSPAEWAGLSEGDLVVAANGRPIGSPGALREAIDSGPLELSILRGTDERTISLDLTLR